MVLPLNVRGHFLRNRPGGLTHFPWIVAANSKAEDEIMPWDFSNSTEKAWQAFEPSPNNNNGLEGQPRPMNGVIIGTTYGDINARRV